MNNGFSNDFYLLDTDAKANKGIGTIHNLLPGRRLTYCLAISNVSKSHVKVNVTRFTSMRATNANTSNRERIIYNTSTVYVEMGWAINMYADAATSSANYQRHIANTALNDGTTDLEDQFSYAAGTAIAKTSNQNYSDVNIEILDTTAISSGSCYLFYTIEFDNLPGSDSFCYEVNSSGEQIYEEPSSGTRRFVVNSSGNSSCYEGLSFEVNAISVTEADS